MQAILSGKPSVTVCNNLPRLRCELEVESSSHHLLKTSIYFPRSHHLIFLPLFDCFVVPILLIPSSSSHYLSFTTLRPSPLPAVNLDSRLGEGTVSLGETSLRPSTIPCFVIISLLLYSLPCNFPIQLQSINHTTQRTSFSLSIVRNRHHRPCTISPSANSACYSICHSWLRFWYGTSRIRLRSYT